MTEPTPAPESQIQEQHQQQQRRPEQEDLNAIVAAESLDSSTNEETIRQRCRSVREELPLSVMNLHQNETSPSDPSLEDPSSVSSPDQRENDYQYITALQDASPPSSRITSGDIILICLCIGCIIAIVYAVTSIIYFYL